MPQRNSVEARLKRAMLAGSLTTADLSIWFARPYATVRGWLQGYEPWGPHGEESRRLLGVLEQAIQSYRGFPVPVHLSPIERRKHMKRLRHGLDGRFSQTRSAQ